MNNKINIAVDEINEWMISHRRDIHMNPELSRKEFRTSKKIIDVLNELGIEVVSGYYNTGVVGIINGNMPGKTIALRFDMDALEMEELTEHSYKSLNEGVMHSCGHDGHTAMGLGVAKALISLKDEIHGTIKLIFQPAEEDSPNGGGAKHMIEEGVLDNPKVDYAIGMHLWPTLKLGEVGTKPGVLMASSDPFTIDIKGKGVHASMPYRGIDPIVIGAQIINNIQTIISRNIDPFESAVISIGVFKGGTRYNIIPEKVHLEGTVRTFNDNVRDKIHIRLKKIVEDTASSLGGAAVLNYKFSYPALINDENLYGLVKNSIIEAIGEENYVEINKPELGGEDFAYFAKEIPSLFMYLGYDDGSEIFPPHSPYYDFNEKALSIGVKVFIQTAIDLGKINI